MKRVAVVVLVAGCSALFGIDKIPYEGPDGGTRGPIQLDVMIVGLGAGSVTDPAMRINCSNAGGTGCTATYDAGTSITLTAEQLGSSTFEQWAGACTGSASSCTLNDVSGTVYVFAEFEDIPPGDEQIQLEPMGSGSGSGAYIMTPDGPCAAGMPCTLGFAPGTLSVLLTAVSGSESFKTFSGGGCVMDIDTCTVDFNQGSNGTSVMVQYEYLGFGTGSTGGGE